MIVVIQCAASKRPDAGHMIANDGRPVQFVANPRIAPTDDRELYAHPDDVAGNGKTWRQRLIDYNGAPGDNPLALRPAFALYERDVYSRLVEKFGVERTYILSAGWGLIRADFLTPSYDITFSPSAELFKRRRRKDSYCDFEMLPNGIAEDLLFLGGKDYLPLFRMLTGNVRIQPIIFYNSIKAPTLNHCILRRFDTTTRTNWHYECADAIIRGAIRV